MLLSLSQTQSGFWLGRFMRSWRVLHISLIDSPLPSVQLLRNAHDKLGLVNPIDQPLVIAIATINYLSTFPVDTTTVQNYKDIVENLGLSFDSPKYVRDVIPGVEAVFLGRPVAWCQRKAFMLGHNIRNVCIAGFCIFLPDNNKENETYFKKIKIDRVPKTAAAFGAVFIVYRKGPVKSVLSLFFSKLLFFFFFNLLEICF